MRRLTGVLPLLFAGLLAAACLAASASEPMAAVVVAGDSVFVTPEYVNFDPTTEQNGPVDSSRISVWLATDSAATAQRVTNLYGASSAAFQRFAWPIAAFPQNIAVTITYAVQYGRVNVTGTGWSTPTAKTVSFTNVFSVPLAPTPAKVRLRAGPGYN